ncbi:MAG: hypothetical protein FJW83_07815 [Actinobacteria bacterium]|nr:hypothetical protein [Actinomycetota bacterium]
MPEGLGDAAGELAHSDHAAALVDTVEVTLGPWVVRVVCERMVAWAGAAPADVVAEAERAAAVAVADVLPRLRALVALDVDEQRTNPLAVLRSAVRHPTEVLARAGVPHVRRDPFDERAFPDDVYGLAPASFADIDPALHEPGLRWGASKAHVVLRRRRAEGRR